MPLSAHPLEYHTLQLKDLPPQAQLSDSTCTAGAGHSTCYACTFQALLCTRKGATSPLQWASIGSDAEQHLSQGLKLSICFPSSPACLTTPQHASLAFPSRQHFPHLMKWYRNSYAISPQSSRASFNITAVFLEILFKRCHEPMFQILLGMKSRDPHFSLHVLAKWALFPKVLSHITISLWNKKRIW